MTVFRYRSLALACCTFIIGLWLFFKTERYELIIGISAALFALLAVTAVFILITHKARQALLGLVLLSFSFLFLFLSAWQSFYQRILPAQELKGTTGIFEASVQDLTKSNNLYVELSSKVNVFCSFTSESELLSELPEKGDKILLKLSFDKEPFSDYPFYFDAKSFFNSKGYYLSANIEAMTLTQKSQPTILENVQSFIREQFGKMNYSRLASAVFMGDEASQELSQALKLSGTSHLLAVSGLHVSIILFSIQSLLDRTKLRLRSKGLILSIFAFCYLILLDFSPSVTRAVIMSFISLWALPLRKNSDSITNLFLAMSLLLLFDPQAATDTSAIMSFLASFGILKFSTPLILKLHSNKFFVAKSLFGAVIKECIKWISDSLLVSFGAILFTLPMMLSLSKSLTISSPLANIFLIGIFTPLLCCVFIYLCVSSIFSLLGLEALSLVLARICDFVFFLFEKLSLGLSSVLPPIKLSLHQFTDALIGGLGAALAFVGVIKIKPKKLILICLLIPLVFFASDAVIDQSTEAKVIALWDDQDQCLIVSSKGKNHLFVSELSYNDQKLLELAKSCNINSFDSLVLFKQVETDSLYKLISDGDFKKLISTEDDGSAMRLCQELSIPFENADLKENVILGEGIYFKVTKHADAIASDIFINEKPICYRFNFDNTPVQFNCSGNASPRLVLLSNSPKMYYGEASDFFCISTSAEHGKGTTLCTKTTFMVYLYSDSCSYVF